MRQRPPSSTRTDTHFPDTTLVRSHRRPPVRRRRAALGGRSAAGRPPQPYRQRFRRRVRRRTATAAGPLGVGRSVEHTSELPSLLRNSFAFFCLTNQQNVTTCCAPAGAAGSIHTPVLSANSGT